MLPCVVERSLHRAGDERNIRGGNWDCNNKIRDGIRFLHFLLAWPIAKAYNVGMKTLHDIRASLGMDQKQLAEALAVSQATVSRWESGKMFPSYHTAKRIVALVAEHNLPMRVAIDDIVRAA